MKKNLIPILFFLLLSAGKTITAQSGSSCDSAVPVTINPQTGIGQQLNNKMAPDTYWFSFVATATSVHIILRNEDDTSFRQIETIFLVGGTCGGLNEFKLAADSVILFPDSLLEVNFSSLVVGDTFKIVVIKDNDPAHCSTCILNGNDTAFFDLIIESPVAPAGSTCGSAIVFDLQNNCMPQQTVNSSEVWYSFTATSMSNNFIIVSGPASPLKPDSVIVYDGSCGNLRQQISINVNVEDTIRVITDFLVAGNTYFLKVKISGTDCRGCQSNYSLCQLISPPQVFSSAFCSLPCDFVCNGDFELHTYGNGGACCDVWMCDGWVSPTGGTSDFFTNAASSSSLYSTVGPPPNVVSGGSAHSGGDYMGIGVYDTKFSNDREYIAAWLKCSLVEGQSYEMSFWYKLPAGSKSAVKDLGVSFYGGTAPNSIFINTTYAPVTPSSVLYLSTTSITPALGYLSNSNWTQIKWTFVAPPGSSLMTHFCIGNFLNDASTSPVLAVNGNGTYDSYYLIDDVSLIPAPCPLTVSANPSTICYNGCTTLTASCGGYGNNIWFPGPFTGNSVNVCDIETTTTYTLTSVLCQSDDNTCVSTQTVTVNVDFVQNVNAGPDQIFCPGPGNQILLQGTANGTNLTYSWTPSNGLSSPNSLQTTATPTVNTSYTLTVTNPTCGTFTDVVNVEVECNCNFLFHQVGPLYTLNGSFNNGTFGAASTTSPTLIYWNGNINVVGTINFINCVIVIAPGVSVNVKNGAQLNISNCHLSSCSNMWQGIIIENGGRVAVTNNTLFEDAVIGIDASQTLGSVSYKIITIDNAVFNRNGVDVQIGNYQVNQANYPYLFQNAVFTSRDLNIGPLAACPPTFAATLKGNVAVLSVLNAPYDLATRPTLFPKVPHNLTPAFTCFNLKSVGTFSGNGNNANTYRGVNIGEPNNAANFIICDYKRYGIFADNANFETYNGAFTFMQEIKTAIVLNPPPPTGTGIAAYFSSSNITRRRAATEQTAGISGALPVYFYDCQRASSINDYYFLNIRNSKVFTTRLEPTPTNPITNQYGLVGHFAKSSIFGTINISNNEIYACETGINVIASVSKSTTQTQNLGDIYVNDNIITGQIQNFSPSTNHYCKLAVNISDALSGTPLASPPGLPVHAENNQIINIYNGINVNGFFNKPSAVRLNYIQLIEDPFLGTTSQTQAGIQMVNCGQNLIYDNNVNGTNTGDATVKEIITSANTSMTLKCNFVGNNGNGFEFQGTQVGTKWWDNTMDNNVNGMVLSFNGFIGPQIGPASNNAIDNQWTTGSPWSIPSNPQTLADNSNAFVSPLNVRFGAAYRPTANYQILGTEYKLVGSQSIFTVFSPGPFRSCSSLPQPPACPNCRQADIAVMEKIVQDSIPSVVFITENKFNSKMHVYRTLRNDPTFISSSAILQNFYNSSISSSKNIISNAEDNLANGNAASAQTAVAGLNPQNNIEQNHKNVLNAGINHSNNVFVASDSAAIVSLANGCPFTDGIAVYQARALYNEVYNSAVLFYDNCPNQSGQRKGSASSEPESITKNQSSFLIYPNPAKDEFFVSATLAEKEVSLIIQDISGKVIYQSKVILENGVGKIKPELENGIYLVTIKTENTAAVQKLLITK